VPREVEIIPAGADEKIYGPHGKRKNIGSSILCVGTVGAKREDSDKSV